MATMYAKDTEYRTITLNNRVKANLAGPSISKEFELYPKV